ncbi:excinuclease ABC subunit UvrA [Kitasatospora sp. NPDC051984]|uniref:excinuclease ABC subunit UvrA n=1 Tax=Kitasatospora sp. NPDC051984 TaxID=3364059 RepID=UPI0037C98022
MAHKRVPDRASWITVEKARTHNLRDVTVRVPKHRLTVFTGVSGSGKSSLAFDTIAAEADRLVTGSYPVFVRNRLPQHPAANVDRIDGLTFTTIIDQRRFTGSARSTVGTASDIAPMLRLLFSRVGRPSAGFSPAYSFNDPTGMCPHCEGLGVVDDIDLDRLLDRSLSLREGAIRFPTFEPGTYRWKRLVDSGLADVDVSLRNLPGSVVDTLLYAEEIKLTNPLPGYPKHGTFDGVIPRLRNSYLRKAPSRLSDEVESALSRIVFRRACPDCGGTRLNEAARGSLIGGRSIADWSNLPITELHNTAASVNDPTVAPLVTTILERLHAFELVGLGYLSLDRESSTLSGGEAQRVKIVRHLGSPLSDVCYVFDEPSAGLHPHDVQRLLDLIARLRDAHNTVLVVEHHPAVINAADHIIDLGPGGGTLGGIVTFEGTPKDLTATDTATGRFLRQAVPLNTTPRAPTGKVRISNARRHNLRDITIDVPLGVLVAVSGVAGSGKSTLFAGELPRQHPDFVTVDQTPLRGGIRSTPATVLGIAEAIRTVFAAASGLPAPWFSANARGACPVCRGKGVVITDLSFLDDVRTECDACEGTRFNPEALAARYHGHTIADVLTMNPEDAVELFSEHHSIRRRLPWMSRVGLDYLTIGQSVDTLSGGERQRLLLARHLADTTTEALRLVLDEPTTGLHGADVDRLLTLFDDLVDHGATIIAIEHNQRVIARADYVVDVGPGAGHQGGTILYQGTPQGLLDAPDSMTGQHLRGQVAPARPSARVRNGQSG